MSNELMESEIDELTEQLQRTEDWAPKTHHLVSRMLDEHAAQRATIQQLEAQIVSLEADVDRMAWKTSPAMAQATIDQLVKRNDQLEARLAESEKAAYDIDETIQHQKQTIEQLEARVKDLEEESRQWEKGSLVALLRENKALKALVVQLQGEA